MTGASARSAGDGPFSAASMVRRSPSKDKRSAVQRILGERGIVPAFAPEWLGSSIYRRDEVAGFMAEFMY